MNYYFKLIVYLLKYSLRFINLVPYQVKAPEDLCRLKTLLSGYGHISKFPMHLLI